MAKKNNNMIGSWAFTIGVIVALLLGLFSGSFGAGAIQWLMIALVIIGILVGLLNVTGSETHTFLITSAILVFVSGQGAAQLATVWMPMSIAFQNLMVMFVPATIVVAIKAVFELARD